MPASLSFIAGLAILRISVAILHVLPTMDPDYTRTSTQPVSLRNHDEKPLEEICRRKYAFYCSCSVFGLRKQEEGKPEWRHFELAGTLSESHLCGRSKPHGAEKQLCEEVNDLFHFRSYHYYIVCVKSTFWIENPVRRNCSLKFEPFRALIAATPWGDPYCKSPAV